MLYNFYSDILIDIFQPWKKVKLLGTKASAFVATTVDNALHIYR